MQPRPHPASGDSPWNLFLYKINKDVCKRSASALCPPLHARLFHSANALLVRVLRSRYLQTGWRRAVGLLLHESWRGGSQLPAARILYWLVREPCGSWRVQPVIRVGHAGLALPRSALVPTPSYLYRSHPLPTAGYLHGPPLPAGPAPQPCNHVLAAPGSTPPPGPHPSLVLPPGLRCLWLVLGQGWLEVYGLGNRTSEFGANLGI